MTDPLTENKRCVICGVGPREVPDRERMGGKPYKRICCQCHGKRLLGDLRGIMEQHTMPSVDRTEN